MKRTQIQFLLAAALIPLSALHAEPAPKQEAHASAELPKATADSPKDVVQAFYTTHFKDFDSVGPGLHKKERWLSKGFLGAIHAYNQKFAKRNTGGEQEGLDGDLFTDSQDTPSKFTVGTAAVKGDHAEVPFTLILADKSKVYETRKSTAKLVNENGAWKIDNLIIGKDDARKLLVELMHEK